MTAITHLTRVRRIIELTAEYFGVTVEELMSDRRSQAVVVPRQVAYYLVRDLTPNSMPAIGRCFKRDHTTVLSGINAISQKAEADPNLAEQIQQLKEALAPEIAAMPGQSGRSVQPWREGMTDPMESRSARRLKLFEIAAAADYGDPLMLAKKAEGWIFQADDPAAESHPEQTLAALHQAVDDVRENLRPGGD